MKRLPQRPDVSVVIPAHNEARRLPGTLEALSDWQQSVGHRVEVIVVDDRSRDGTAEVASAFRPRLQLRVLDCPPPYGVGRAVRAGMLATRGQRVLYTDADGPVPFADVALLSAALDAGFDVAAGSRTLAPQTVEVRQAWHRRLMGRGWSRLVQLILPTHVSDTQCGFKMFSRAAAHALFRPLHSHSFAFHVEALHRAARLGLRVTEVAVRWRDRPNSKIHLLRDPSVMLGELLTLRWSTESRAAAAQTDAMTASSSAESVRPSATSGSADGDPSLTMG